MDVLADLQEDAGHAGILADGHLVTVGDLVVFLDAVQDLLSGRPLLLLTGAGDAVLHVLGQMAVGLHAKAGHHFGDACGIQFSHGEVPPYSTLYSWSMTVPSR